MINASEIKRTLKKNLSKMSYEEREQYFKDMGFSFGTPENNSPRNKPQRIAASSQKRKSGGFVGVSYRAAKKA